jgi:hypothetical protein
VTDNENATGVPRIHARPRESLANHRTVVRLGAIGTTGIALRSAAAAADLIQHIRNHAVEFRAKTVVAKRDAAGGRLDEGAKGERIS